MSTDASPQSAKTRRGSRDHAHHSARISGKPLVSRSSGLVAVMYSSLRAAQHDPTLQHKLQRQLKLDLEGSVAFCARELIESDPQPVHSLSFLSFSLSPSLLYFVL